MRDFIKTKNLIKKKIKTAKRNIFKEKGQSGGLATYAGRNYRGYPARYYLQ